MSLAPRPRLKKLVFFALVTCGAGAILLFQRQVELDILTTKQQKWSATAEKLEQGLIFGTFADQKVDDFTANLSKKLRALTYRYAVLQSKIERTDLYALTEIEQATKAKLALLSEIKLYRDEANLMAHAWVDYNLLRHKPLVLNQLVNLFKSLAKVQEKTHPQPETTEAENRKHVTQGQTIGLQGCTGICTGTHIHFVTYLNGSLVDPCELLPKKTLSIWGIDNQCGVEDSKLIWPSLWGWILTQKFDTISPVLNNKHAALDIIDREQAPVLASHSGWASFLTKDCSKAFICNQGAAKVVTICENTDCTKGLATEYWHLAWMLGEE